MCCFSVNVWHKNKGHNHIMPLLIIVTALFCFCLLDGFLLRVYLTWSRSQMRHHCRWICNMVVKVPLWPPWQACDDLFCFCHCCFKLIPQMSFLSTISSLNFLTNLWRCICSFEAFADQWKYLMTGCVSVMNKWTSATSLVVIWVSVYLFLVIVWAR